jgi:hypothetical protein
MPVVAALLSGVWSGCHSPAPLALWQERMTEFIAAHDGDPGALRELATMQSTQAVRPTMIRFGVLDAPGRPSSRDGGRFDVQGLFVGQHEVDDQRWYVFLLAFIQRNGQLAPRITSMRPVAFATASPGLDWCVGASDRKSTARYFNYRHDTPSAAIESFARLGFPRPDDDFETVATDHTITISERKCGANWTLDLATVQGQPEGKGAADSTTGGKKQP